MKKILTILLLTILAIGVAAFTKSDESSKTYTDNISTDNILAISWQNAFCQMNQNKKECRSFKKDAYSSSNFTLHGLWPQPRSRINCQGEKRVWLEKELYKELKKVMPGVKSGLHKHEWKKHGTCYGKSADLYFQDSIYLLKQINSSAVRTLFAKNIGKILNKKEIMMAFDKSFGKGAGRKIKMICQDNLIVELRVSLGGKISPDSDISELIKSGNNLKGGCQKGRVDAVGY